MHSGTLMSGKRWNVTRVFIIMLGLARESCMLRKMTCDHAIHSKWTHLTFELSFAWARKVRRFESFLLSFFLAKTGEELKCRKNP